MDPFVQLQEPIFSAEEVSLMADANFCLDTFEPEFKRFVACLTLFNVRDRLPAERPNPWVRSI